MTLDYLDFDFSEDEHGCGSFDAMASAASAQLPASTRPPGGFCAAFREAFGLRDGE